MQSNSSVVPPYSVQQNTFNQTDVVGNTVVGFLVVFFPSALVLAILLYKRYCASRTTVLERQIAALERMWQISSKQ
jgi:hypothetical protein